MHEFHILLRCDTALAVSSEVKQANAAATKREDIITTQCNMELFTGWLKTEMVFLPIIMYFYSYDHQLDDILRNKELIHTNSVDISYTEDENKHLCLT